MLLEYIAAISCSLMAASPLLLAEREKVIRSERANARLSDLKVIAQAGMETAPS